MNIEYKKKLMIFGLKIKFKKFQSPKWYNIDDFPLLEMIWVPGETPRLLLKWLKQSIRQAMLNYKMNIKK